MIAPIETDLRPHVIDETDFSRFTDESRPFADLEDDDLFELLDIGNVLLKKFANVPGFDLNLQKEVQQKVTAIKAALNQREGYDIP